MAESGREPLIRLPIDQEIYIEVVHDGDIVEDATVAAEVISLEREGAAYEIDGAIVFAGYVRNKRDGGENGDDPEGVAQAGNDSGVEHVHHRLPFRLRVPAAAQQHGVINIKSRLSQFQAAVVSDNWLNLKGNLEIYGLYANEGYHFRCGAQEEGSAFFTEEDALPTRSLEENSEIANAPLSDENEIVRQEVVGSVDGWRSVPDEETPSGDEREENFRSGGDGQEENRSQSLVEKVSEGRHGHGWAEEESNATDDAPLPAQKKVKPLRSELADLDRHFVQQHEDKAVVKGEGTQPDHSRPGPVASFEFEHEIEEEMAQERKNMALQSDTGMSRAQTEEGEDWRPRFSIAGTVDAHREETQAASPGETEEQPDKDSGEDESERHEFVSSSVTDSDLWSFVDFNGPDPRHTLRYVIVMEEDSIETVAERCNCVPSELRRVNSLSDEQIRPGQALYIPAKPFSKSAISVQ